MHKGSLELASVKCYFSSFYAFFPWYWALEIMGIKHLHIFAFETTLKSAYRLTNQLVKLAKILYIKFPQREVPRLAVAGRTYHSLIQTHHIWDQQACTTGRTEGLCFKYFYGWIQRWVWHWLWLVYRHKWTVNDIFLSISRADILALYSGPSHSLSLLA